MTDLPAQRWPVALSLGSNVQPLENLQAAMQALAARFAGARFSPLYRFAAVGFDGPDFLNSAAVIDSDLPPQALNDWMHALEDAQGRDRSAPRWGNRTLDIDIVLVGQQILSGEGHLQVPRDELKHAFVLAPLAEIAPDWLEPRSGQTLKALWHAHPDYPLPDDLRICSTLADET